MTLTWGREYKNDENIKKSNIFFILIFFSQKKICEKRFMGYFFFKLLIEQKMATKNGLKRSN